VNCQFQIGQDQLGDDGGRPCQLSEPISKHLNVRRPVRYWSPLEHREQSMFVPQQVHECARMYGAHHADGFAILPQVHPRAGGSGRTMCATSVVSALSKLVLISCGIDTVYRLRILRCGVVFDTEVTNEVVSSPWPRLGTRSRDALHRWGRNQRGLSTRLLGKSAGAGPGVLLRVPNRVPGVWRRPVRPIHAHGVLCRSQWLVLCR
jgi:hypothetical protein